MDEHWYRQVLAAINATYAAGTSEAHRMEAIQVRPPCRMRRVQVMHPHHAPSHAQFMEQFMSRDDCVTYSMFMLVTPAPGACRAPRASKSCAARTRPDGVAAAEHTETVRVAALGAIERTVQRRWNDASDAQRASVKTQLLQVLMTCLRPSGEGAVLAKLAATITEVAKREWPQRWPELMDALVQGLVVGPVQAQTVMMVRASPSARAQHPRPAAVRACAAALALTPAPSQVLRYLSEDAASTAFNTAMPPQRRKDIIQSLSDALPRLLTGFYSMAESQFATLKRATEAGAGAEAMQAASVSAALLGGLLDMMTAVLEWAPPVLVARHGFVDVFCMLALENNLGVHAARHATPPQAAAMQCLLLLAHRKYNEPAEQEVLLRLCCAVVDVCRRASWADLESDFEFHKLLARTAAALGTEHTTAVVQELAAHSAAHAAQYLELMLTLLRHPRCGRRRGRTSARARAHRAARVIAAPVRHAAW